MKIELKTSKIPTIIVAAFALTCAPGVPSFAQATPDSSSGLPVKDIEQIMAVQGTVDNGVLDLSIDRNDLQPARGPVYRPIVLTPSFELNGDVFFQPLAGGKAFMNGDLCVKEDETQRFIAALINHGLVWQAYHQHFPSHPQYWFIHFRGKGDPLALARGARAAIDTTSTPLPQSPPPHPSTPLDVERLGDILHASSISVGSDGVVTAWIYRTDRITIDGVVVNPQANISTNVEFKPIGGSNAAVVADFSMTSSEVQKVVDLMFNHHDWAQGCLYNQETDEHPQLFFDHMLNRGNAYELAEQIRQGLNLTAAQ
ncbi:MAG: DUF1259 domain-containing protein [Verrucomicrobia bacterium]|nr:DUF1259 domain-containing protein [Verrucomicrobiota bacterium]